MAGPSVAVRILGDLSGWSKSVSDSADAAQTGTSRIKGAFSSVLGTLNKSGVLGPFGESISMVSEAVESMGEKAGSAGAKLLGAGSGLLGLGAGLQALGSSQAAAQQQLATTITNTGKAWSDYSGEVAKAVTEEEHHGESATETMNALQALTQVTHDPTEALKMLGTASDLAAAQHEDLNTAATQLAKTYTGGTRTLKLFGIETLTTKQAAAQLATAQREVAAAAKEQGDKNISAAKATADMKDATDFLTQAQKEAKQAGIDNSGAINELSQRLSGQASAASDTFHGHLDALKASVEDHIATYANKYGPAITAIGAGMTGLGAAIEVTKGITEAMKDSELLATIARDAEAVSTGAVTAATWLWNAALSANPIGIVVLAIAALGAALVEGYQHITVFRNAVNDVWTAVKTVFTDVENLVGDVIGWLRDNWPLVLGILTGPFGLAAAAIATHWADVTTFLKGIPGAIKAIFDDAGTWLVKAGEDIIGGLVKGIGNTAKSAVDAVGNVAKSVVTAPLHIFGIHSPSTVFEDMGRNVVAGFVNGVTATASTATAVIGAIAGSVTSTGSPSTAATGPSSPLVQFGDVTIASGVDLDLVTQQITAALTVGRL